MEKRDFLYEGKTKQVYTTDDPEPIIIHYNDDVTHPSTLRKEVLYKRKVL